jgi:hypothetical protein
MAKSPGTKKTIEEKSGPSPAPAVEPTAAKGGYQLTDAPAFGRNMARVAAQSQQLLSEFMKRQAERFGQEPMDPLNLAGAYFSLLKHMAADPGHMFTAQIALWRDYLNLLQRTGERALGRSRYRRQAIGVSVTRTGRKTRSSTSSNSPIS